LDGTIYIHVGAGKTGTSALQRFFLENRTVLERQGVVLPDIGRTQGNHGLQHHKLADHGKHKNPVAFEDWEDIAALSPAKVVISSELFHNKISTGSGKVFFAKIRDILADWDVKIIFYIRRQGQWLQSAYAQHVKGNIETRSFAEYLDHYTRNLPEQIQDFAEVFGNDALIVRPFEREQFHANEICHDFCHSIGVDWQEDFKLPVGNVNPRLAPDALELKRQLNGLADNPKTLAPALRDLLEYSAQADSEASGKTFHTHTLLDLVQQHRIEKENAPKYRWIAETLMGRSDGVLFQNTLPPLAAGQENAQEAEIDVSRVSVFLLQRQYARGEALQNKVRRLKNRVARLEG